MVTESHLEAVLGEPALLDDAGAAGHLGEGVGVVVAWVVLNVDPPRRVEVGPRFRCVAPPQTLKT